MLANGFAFSVGNHLRRVATTLAIGLHIGTPVTACRAGVQCFLHGLICPMPVSPVRSSLSNLSSILFNRLTIWQSCAALGGFCAGLFLPDFSPIGRIADGLVMDFAMRNNLRVGVLESTRTKSIQPAKANVLGSVFVGARIVPASHANKLTA